MSTTKVARLIKKLDSFRGDARLYSLDPPMQVRDWDSEEAREVTHVAVSATVAMFSGPETYIFESDEDGNVVNWGELDGSFRGSLDHAEALEGAGYEVAA